MSIPELNRMFEDALARDASWEAVGRMDAAHLAEYDLTGEEVEALRAPDPGGLAALGVHPMLAMWGSLMRNPAFSAQMSAAEYFTQLPERTT